MVPATLLYKFHIEFIHLSLEIELNLGPFREVDNSQGVGNNVLRILETELGSTEV